jgi:peptidyl-prolyl cis-trans isomerase SurA
MKRFSRLLISLIVLSASVVHTNAYALKQTIDRTAVMVNNEVLLESDIEKFRQKMKSRSYQELFGGVDPTILANREAVLQLMVEEKIINQQVKKLELQATEQEVDSQIRNITKRNGITVAQLSERVKQLGSTMADYREAIKRQLERKNLIDREIKPTLEVSEEQLRHFYLRNHNPQDAEATYKLAHILIQPKGSNIKEAQKRAQKVWALASKNSAEFGKYVAEYSDDTSSVEASGLLGDFSLSQMAEEFRATVSKTPVNGITKPLKTNMGFHILKVLEKKFSDFASLSKERKEALRNQLGSEELEKKMTLWLERKKAESHIKVITNAAK